MKTNNGAAMIPYSMKLKQDSDGRIAEKVETAGGREMTWEYAYDKDGRLVEARLDRRVACQCGYDGQGRRAWDRFPLRKTRKEFKYGYTSDNRLHSAGKSSYVHDRNGFRKIWNSAGRYTLYEYSRDHRLLKVEVENEDRVFEFAHDENGQRKAKYLNGELVEAYKWFDVVRMDAFFDGQDAYEFVYEERARLPYAMRRGDGTVLLLYYDQVGSLRVVADASGNVIKEILYDPFGGIIEDSRPELRIPLGFAGGLHDRDLGFVRFGWRDYDIATGRWTAPDPLGDKGGDPDWYGYCLDDPVNAVDPLGLELGDWWDLPRNYTRAIEIADEEMALRGKGNHNNEGDAMRHAEWSRRMAEELGSGTSLLFGFGHEIDGLINNGQPWSEMMMDLHNNAEGRAAARENRNVDRNNLQKHPRKGFQINPYSTNNYGF